MDLRLFEFPARPGSLTAPNSSHPIQKQPSPPVSTPTTSGKNSAHQPTAGTVLLQQAFSNFVHASEQKIYSILIQDLVSVGISSLYL